ncbi:MULTISPECIES: SMEK domain-containing protein [Xanthomonas]|uniref:SMEK domain-containing protein n=1 Tax=Xanthomonas axonopodis pv. cajani TaxID=487827 RepID=A0ABX3M7G2_9XANT|nr:MULTISPECIES: SMEK domain-containing protein [Xanthomonas]KHL64686.1 hypothetical protein XEU83M_16005 [Xanthomonas euvesicatoria]KLB44976.1 hypothetical protein XEUV259_17265 [Xanthomonas euvesicatoria]MCC8726251.1 SMEK domain-containing protein [Xanthomonas euvesicatoria pv. euvesicatoria]MCC8743193.1 SMEK domain-containing protein [Xanthomonas euvesicatoria pv. euvesicatoria]MCC8747455.1 SMEK domain-containing protein [Xanthomonas euvesicatoria pv. euvesicatoria]
MYIGEIVDEFASIAAQVKVRNKLGLTDLSKFCENYFRDVLNCLLGANFENLNKDIPNAPALDLGDRNKKLAVQISSAANASKVNSTLLGLTQDMKSIYTDFFVLSIGGKQSTYALDKGLADSVKFKVANIWDMDTLAHMAIDLEIDRLADLHRLVRRNSAKVRVELEIPDENGDYPTNGYDQWEPRIEPAIGNGAAFVEFTAAEGRVTVQEVDHAEIECGLKILGAELARLPRVSREFLVSLIERRESKGSVYFDDKWIHLLYEKVKREFRGSDLIDELGILEHAGFVKIRGVDAGYDRAPEIGVRLSHQSDALSIGLLGFVKAKGLNLRNVIGAGDLSQF